MRALTKLFAAFFFVAFTVAAAHASVTVRVDISKQSMTVSENGNVVYVWKVSTARKGYRNPTGTFKPIRMHRMWYSRKYDNSPMPHSIFYYGGYAIHGTYEERMLGRPASHGCIRLSRRNARTLYNLVKAQGPRADRVHDRYSPGLHHVAWKAESRADVEAMHELVKSLGATVLDAPADYPQYGPGYYAVFFADPDGLKLEYVYKPGD